MFKNRKIQMLGIAILIVAALLIVLSAVRLPASVQIGAVENDRAVVESNPAGLAQYHLGERGSNIHRQVGWVSTTRASGCKPILPKAMKPV